MAISVSETPELKPCNTTLTVHYTSSCQASAQIPPATHCPLRIVKVSEQQGIPLSVPQPKRSDGDGVASRSGGGEAPRQDKRGRVYLHHAVHCRGYYRLLPRAPQHRGTDTNKSSAFGLMTRVSGGCVAVTPQHWFFRIAPIPFCSTVR